MQSNVVIGGKYFVLISVLHGTLLKYEGGGPRVVVSTAAFHARVRGSVPGLSSLKETKMFLPHPRVKVSIVGSLHDREVACSASDRQDSNFSSCVWRTVSSQSSHHPQEVYWHCPILCEILTEAIMAILILSFIFCYLHNVLEAVVSDLWTF